MSVEPSQASRYTPSPRKWTQKSWLYEQYWGNVKSIEEVAASTDVSRQSILRAMKDKGIPRRPPSEECETVEDVRRMYGVNSHDTSFEQTPTRTWDEVVAAASN